MTTTTDTTFVNGIDTALVRSTAEAVAGDAALGQAHVCIATEWTGQTHTRSTVRKLTLGGQALERPFVIEVDEPAELGGGNRFANPQEYLLSAVNACILTTFAAYCALQDIHIRHLSMETKGDIDLRKFLGLDPSVPAGFEALDYTIRVSADADTPTLNAIHDAVRQASPNFFNMATAVAMDAKLTVS